MNSPDANAMLAFDFWRMRRSLHTLSEISIARSKSAHARQFVNYAPPKRLSDVGHRRRARLCLNSFYENTALQSHLAASGPWRYWADAK